MGGHILDHIAGTVFGLYINSTYILAQYADAHEFDAAKEEHGDHHGGIAGNVVAQNELLANHEETVEEGKACHGHADIAPDAEKDGGEGGEAFHGQVPQFPPGSAV